MSRFISIIILLNAWHGHSQVFNETFGDDGFDMLIKHPLVFVKTGDPGVDVEMQEALESSWTFSDFVVLEQGDGPSYNQCFIAIILMRESFAQNFALAILPGEYYTKPAEYSRAVSYMLFNGFYTPDDYLQPKMFLKLIVNIFNKTVTLIRDERITGSNKNVEYEVQKKAEEISGMRLIVYDMIIKLFIPEIELVSRGINYQIVDKNELTEMIKNPTEGDYLVYLAKNAMAEFSIINMVDGSLLFTKHTAITNLKSKVKLYLNLIENHF
jgi:hypothetical protein